MYWSSILWFISWPALVVLGYQLIKLVVSKYQDTLEKPLKKSNSKE